MYTAPSLSHARAACSGAPAAHPILSQSLSRWFTNSLTEAGVRERENLEAFKKGLVCAVLAKTNYDSRVSPTC